MDSRINRRSFLRKLGLGAAAGSALGALRLTAGSRVYAQERIQTRAHDQGQVVDGPSLYHLPFRSSHVAAYWEGEHDAAVQAEFSSDGLTFSAPQPVQHDEVGSNKQDGRTYGAVIRTGGATVVRISSDRKHLVRVVAMADGQRSVTYHRTSDASAAPASPAVVARAGWGCDESLMTWAPDFYPVHKLICHHTATQNGDPDPKGTIRAIYYYHAVTQAWGDIGYNFLVDESGVIYEGRHSGTYPLGVYPTGEDAFGRGVTGAHAYQYNSGTVGMALLGTLTAQDTTAAGRQGLERLLAWKAGAHGLDPNGAAIYTNPVTRVSTTFPNISGHRDVVATECPGGVFYSTLPTVRKDVVALFHPVLSLSDVPLQPAGGPH
jgi:hypothetical protein